MRSSSEYYESRNTMIVDDRDLREKDDNMHVPYLTPTTTITDLFVV